MKALNCVNIVNINVLVVVNLDREAKEMFNLIIEKLNNLESGLNAKLEEHSEYLQALLHSAEVSKAERDKMSMDIAINQGELERIKNDFKIHRHKITLNTSEAETEANLR